MNAVVAEQIRTTVEARLRELAPVLTELEQLRSVLAVLDDPDAWQRMGGASVFSALGGDPRGMAFGVAAPVTALPRARRLGSRPGRDGRAPQGSNKQRIVTVIAEQPGITAPEIAKLIGLKRPVVASTISRLKRTGELCTHGRGVRVAESGNGTAPAPAVRSSERSVSRIYAARSA